jgi:low temperature requirement protein LtrA
MWWAYFDVVAIFAERRLSAATPGREQNAIARDSYGVLHVLMIAGVVLVALGLKKVLLHVGDPLHTVPAVALVGGTALYLFGHLCFRLRNVHTLSYTRTVTIVVLLVLIPVALEVPALASLTIVTAVLVAMTAFEAIRYREARERVRHGAGQGH